MSGHSKWETTKRQKAAEDAKRGAAFTKLSNIIAIAARGGTDPSMNPSLAMAVERARRASMPASTIQRAIARGADKSATALEEVVYEAYGPGGTGIVIEAATDNRNRTFPDVKTVLNKNGGSIAAAGSVLFQFTRKGVIEVDATGDDNLMTVLDAGAEDAQEIDGKIIAYTDMKDLHKVRTAIVNAGLTVEDAELKYIANDPVVISDAETARKALKLLSALDDLDDVTNVHTNADIVAEV